MFFLFVYLLQSVVNEKLKSSSSSSKEGKKGSALKSKFKSCIAPELALLAAEEQQSNKSIFFNLLKNNKAKSVLAEVGRRYCTSTPATTAGSPSRKKMKEVLKGGGEGLKAVGEDEYE